MRHLVMFCPKMGHFDAVFGFKPPLTLATKIVTDTVRVVLSTHALGGLFQLLA